VSFSERFRRRAKPDEDLARKMTPNPFLPRALAFLLMLLAGDALAGPMNLDEYMALDGPEPTAHVAYGRAPSQYAELFLPAGKGPFPVVVLVHGGCWNSKFGGIVQMRHMAGELQKRGVAVWNVEYRRLDEDGGGYPGTFRDMNAAMNELRTVAAARGLDLTRLVAVGHSAGGQLVQWLAGRARIPAQSLLHEARPVPVRHVVSLGGLADLRHERALIRQTCDTNVDDLTGKPSTGRADVYSDTNAAALTPNGSSTVLITGELDDISPPRVARDYARMAQGKGDDARVVIVPGASHYDEVSTKSAVWPEVWKAVALGLGIHPN